jgi:type II secretory pathway pseudopilin PulG
MSPMLVSLTVAVVILSGGFAGRALRQRLPNHHLEGDSKDIVKAGIALLSTLAALVLGLIIGAAKASFDAQAADVQTAAAKLAMLDRTLTGLGPAAAPLRADLASAVSTRVSAIWGASERPEGFAGISGRASGIETFRAALAQVAPADARQQQALAQASQLLDELMQIRFLAIGHGTSPITLPLLTLLTFWFAIIALGLNLFAPSNGTILAVNVLCALSLGGAIFLILEMEHPFGGVITLPDAPLRATLAGMR